MLHRCMVEWVLRTRPETHTLKPHSCMGFIQNLKQYAEETWCILYTHKGLNRNLLQEFGAAGDFPGSEVFLDSRNRDTLTELDYLCNFRKGDIIFLPAPDVR